MKIINLESRWRDNGTGLKGRELLDWKRERLAWWILREWVKESTILCKHTRPSKTFIQTIRVRAILLEQQVKISDFLNLVWILEWSFVAIYIQRLWLGTNFNRGKKCGNWCHTLTSFPNFVDNSIVPTHMTKGHTQSLSKKLQVFLSI